MTSKWQTSNCVTIITDMILHIPSTPQKKKRKKERRSTAQPIQQKHPYFGSYPKFCRICSKKINVSTVWGPRRTNAGIKPCNIHQQSNVILYCTSSAGITHTNTVKSILYFYLVKKEYLTFISFTSILLFSEKNHIRYQKSIHLKRK